MIDEICAEINNYFAYDEDKHIGVFKIEDGQFMPSLDLPTNYIRIIGSRLNEGVHKISDNDLSDETFDGAVWIMSPPIGFLNLVNDIEAWQIKFGAVDVMSPYMSESFGVYSRSSAATNDGSLTWKNAFGAKLNKYRRIRGI